MSTALALFLLALVAAVFVPSLRQTAEDNAEYEPLLLFFRFLTVCLALFATVCLLAGVLVFFSSVGVGA